MMTGAAARWVPGDQVVIAWPGGVALVDASVGLPGAERIWSRLRRDSQLGTFLKTLSEGAEAGFLDLPSFAIVVRDEHRWHIAVRGAVPVAVQVAGTVETLSGEGITTWAERVVTDPEAIRMGTAHPGLDGAAIADGVVPAGGVSLGEMTTSSATPDAADQRDVRTESSGGAAPAPGAASPDFVGGVVPGARAPGTSVPESVGRVGRPAPVSRPQPSSDEVPFSPPSEPLDERPAEPDEPAEPPAPTPLPPVHPAPANTTLADAEELEDEVVEAAGPPQSNPYDSLWDHSIAMDVEAAAIRAEPEAQPAAPAPDAAPATAADAVMTAPRQAADQLSGDTVADEGLVEVVMPGSAPGPQVLARFCDRGHPNPPERAECFACGAPVAGEARTTARPQLGWLRVEGGETIPLRGPVIAGRNPRSTALKLDETPRLVALPHPHVSSTHLAILIEGWRLMARDLRSSNGTFLRRHGKPPVRLPETAVPLVPGDLIDLGKGLFLHLDRTP